MQTIFPRITYHLSLNFLTVIHSFHPVSFHRKRKIKKKKKKGVIIYTRNVRILTFINPRNRARTANTQVGSYPTFPSTNTTGREPRIFIATVAFYAYGHLEGRITTPVTHTIHGYTVTTSRHATSKCTRWYRNCTVDKVTVKGWSGGKQFSLYGPGPARGEAC